MIKSHSSISEAPSSVPVPKETSFLRSDLLLVIMGFFFLAMPILEYLYVGSSEERQAIKVLNGAQAAFALVVVLLSGKAVWESNRVALAFLLLFLWVCAYEIRYATTIEEMLYTWVIYLYWMALLLFFFVRAYQFPATVQTFLLLTAVSLLFWVPALIASATASTATRGWGFRVQDYSGYYLVALLPYVLLLSKPLLKVGAIALISFGAVYSLKRGVVLALLLMGFSSAIVYLKFVSKERWKARAIFLVVGSFAVAMASAMLFLHDHSEDARRRLGADTGRSRIYSDSVEAIKSGDFVDLFLGNVDRRIQDKVGTLPHNDWLYLLHDFGLLSVFIMLLIYLALFGFLRRLCRGGSPLAVPLASSIVLMFCVQAYSYGFFLKTFGLITGGMGIILGLHHATRRTKTISAEGSE